ncbi:sugar-binding protein [Bifidobacterium pullorum subsp. saeculare]|uniref:galactosylceramidase n=1 Tax=Bifidobacterium pullorum subsp. saeculare TaxID=78257 RepID=A0A939B9Y5_9BIFI|nr:hypothetical protein [Bifidobacterium pullorum]MBM6700023.1 sugar-binding protein [Bifidobacterium pullorum subsp. saeculare]
MMPSQRNATAQDRPVTVMLTAADVAAAAANRNGLTYKGFGVLSGNATSSMLMDYRAEHPDAYRRLVRTLFGGPRPIMNTVKVEMGNDRNNSTGPEACTMREPGEYPAVGREPGFQLAADAAEVQPGVRVSILRWMAPTWVHGNDDVYRWYKNTILACYRAYGFMVGSVNPDVNERTADLDWVAEFARRVRQDETGFEVDPDAPADPSDPAAHDPAALPDSLGGRLATAADAGWSSDEERALFHRIKVITSDEEVTGTFAGQLFADPRYMDAVDVAAYHYSVVDDEEGGFTRLAEQADKEVWNSEAQAVFSNSADRPNNTNGDGLADPVANTGIGGPGGPLEMANTLIKGFVRSRRTHAIYQPAIGACHKHMEYASKELVSARDPWSGWMYFDAGCAVLEHFCACAKLGWAGDDPAVWRAIPAASGCEVGGDNPVNGARHGEPSYLTLAAPDGADFSTVIVNDSALPREYRIAVDPALPAAGRPAEVWQTRAAEPGERYDAAWRRRVGVIEPVDGPDGTTQYALTVRPWSMVTVTTLADVAPYAIPATPEASRPVLDEDPAHGVLHADAFDDPARGARYATDTNGAFEVVPDPECGHALRQQIDWTHAGDAWIEGEPRTTIGDMRWTNYRVSVDVRFEPYPGRAPYVLLGARDMGGDKFTTDLAGYDFKLRADGVWLLRRYGDEKHRGHLEDLRRRAAEAGAPAFRPGAADWFTLSLEVAGPTVTVRLNGAEVTRWTDDRPQTAGRVMLGTSFDHVRFSRLRVERVPGFSPHYAALVDDMHLVSWDDSRTPVLRYDGEWEHRNGQGMFTYLRSISRTSRIGASLTHTFDGTGLDVFGPSDGDVLLDVFVDGRLAGQRRRTQANEGSLRTQLHIGGLEPGRHTVTLRLANQALWQVDAIGALA